MNIQENKSYSQEVCQKSLINYDNIIAGYTYELKDSKEVNPKFHNTKIFLETANNDGLTVRAEGSKCNTYPKFPFPSQLKNSCTLPLQS